MDKPVISVVVPVYNEEGNLKDICARIKKALLDFQRSFEIIFVNDASIDSTEKILTQLYNENTEVSVINLFKNSGKAVALERGFELVDGKYIVIIDADMQQAPEDIPKLIEKLEEGYDVVSCKRMERNDAKGKVLTSKIFNILMRLITGLRIDDYFSGLKAFRFGLIRFLSLYGDLYRFAAVFAFKEGFKVAEVASAHHPRAHGDSKYNFLGRLKMAAKDVLTVIFSITLRRSRVYVLGICGLACLSVALTLAMIALYQYGSGDLAFKSLYGFLALCLFFIGGQMLIIKKVANNFFVKHYTEYQHRQRNVASILNAKEKNFS